MAPFLEEAPGGPDDSLTSIDKDKSMPIAVVGMSFRGPKDATSVENLWKMISERREGWTEIPKEKWNNDAFYHPDNTRHGTINVKGGHFFQEDLALFDAPFFNMTSAEAEALDPQQRLLLEGTFEAIESGGIPLEKFAGSKTSCFVGSFSGDYTDMFVRDPDCVPMYQCTNAGQSRAITANRVSYFFDLKGPSVTVDTACSGSLVALHLACQSIRTGDASMAVAAGVNTVLSHEFMTSMSMMRFLSPDGRCYTFDERANGYARGEGVGVLILKPLKDALKDNDTIRAVIRGSGSNSDGRTSGITLPSGEAQERMIRDVYDAAGLDPLETEYVECHGTGTQAGDPQETGGLARVFSPGRSVENPLRIGSVKTNVGHLEGASGIAGVIKAILILENKTFLPNRNFETLNPRILLDEWKLKIQLDLEPWLRDGPHRISVNSFGYGGSNAHVILEDPSGYLTARKLKGSVRKYKALVSRSENGLTNGFTDAQIANGQTDSAALNGSVDGDTTTGKVTLNIVKYHHPQALSPRLFTLSSFDEASGKKQIERLRTYLAERLTIANDEFMNDLAYTLNERRSNLMWTQVVSATTAESLIDALARVGKATRSTKKPTIGFVFTGQGAQWCGMGKELLQYKVFSDSIDRIGAHLTKLGAPFDVRTELTRDPETSKINIALYSQPMCSAVQIAIIDLIGTWGVKPASVTGHSSGEIAAAYTMGALSMEDAMAVAYFRGLASHNMQQSGLRKGAMMAVGMTQADVLPYLAELKQGTAVVACVNSPTSLTISGDVAAIDELQSVLDGKKIFARKLAVEVAYHSPHMAFVEEEYRNHLADVKPKEGKSLNDPVERGDVEFFSSVFGAKVTAADLGPEYWIANMLGQVKFADSLRLLCLETTQPSAYGKSALRKKRAGAAAKVSVDMIIEIGPHSALAGPIKQVFDADNKIKANKPTYGSALIRKKSAVTSVLDLIGSLLSSGFPVDIAAINQPIDGMHYAVQALVDLPPYAWNHSNSYWAEPRVSKVYRHRKFPRTDLLGVLDRHSSTFEPRWRNHLRVSEIPWIKDHKIQSNVIFPAAGYIAIALEAAFQVTMSAHPESYITAYEIRDVIIGAALMIDDHMSCEIMTSLRPYEHSGVWYEFSICSVTADNRWTEHTRGLVSALTVVKDSHSDVLQRLETAKAACEQPVNIPDFYKHLASIGLEYGDTFAGMTKAYSTKNACVAEIAISDTAATMPQNFQYPLAVHPSTLDAVFHPIFVALSAERLISNPAVPTSVDHIYVSNTLGSQPGHVLQVCATTQMVEPGQLVADLAVVDGEHAGIVIGGLKCTVLTNGGDETSEQSAQRVAYNLEWQPDVYSLPNNKVSASMTGETSSETVANYLGLIGHQNPHMTILEINAGAGSDTSSILETLSAWSDPFPFQRYTVTDPDVAALEQFQHNLEAFRGLVKIKELDIEKDVKDQGFDPDTFDVILVGHGSSSLKSKTTLLKNVHTMLKPRGHLILVDNVETEQLWGEELISQGFSGIVLSAKDGSGCAVMGSQAIADVKAEAHDVVIIAEEEECGVDVPTLNDMICSLGLSVKLSTFATAETTNKTCIILSELKASLLAKPDERSWETIRNIFIRSEGVLWVTRGGTLASGNPDANLVVGFARTARSEHGDHPIVTLDLDAENLASSEAATITIFKLFEQNFTRGLSIGSMDTEYAERDGVLMIPRVSHAREINDKIVASLGSPIPAEQLFYQNGRPLQAVVDTPGQLGGIHFVSKADRSVVPDNCLKIEVRAAGIGKKDAQLAFGQPSAMLGLGSECSGIVCAIGSNVHGFKVGDEVAAFGWATVANYHLGPEDCFQTLPAGMTFDLAAAIPIAYCTAYYAIYSLARVCRGESVLIQEANEPTGQALIELCKLVGAKVLAIVDSVDLKHALRHATDLPESSIVVKGEGSFVREARRWTQNCDGVDVVFSSASAVSTDEERRLAWDCLAAGGRYIELGGQRLTNGSRLEMGNFAKDVSFISFDFNSLVKRKRDVASKVFADVMTLFRTGAIRGFTQITNYSASELDKAIQSVHDTQTISKVVVNANHDTVIKAIPEDDNRRLLSPDASYLLVGGLGGIGRATAMWMLDHGAQNIMFANRSGLSRQESKDTVAALEARGARVAVYACDVSDSEAVQEMTSRATVEMPPIRGVIQAAMVLKDAMIEKLSAENYNAVLQPKYQGTWNLHRFLPTNMDFFIMLSSISGVIGNASQSAYAAGGTFLDAFAAYRNAMGLPAVTLDLGVITGIGYLSENKELLAAMEAQGFEGTDETKLMALIKSAVIEPNRTGAASQTITGLGNWKEGQSLGNFDSPIFAKFRRYALDTTGGASASASDTVRDSLRDAATMIEAVQVVCGAIVNKLASRLGMPVDNIVPEKTISEYGVDSLVGVEFRNWIAKELEASMAIMEVLANQSLTQLSTKIAAKSKLVKAKAEDE